MKGENFVTECQSRNIDFCNDILKNKKREHTCIHHNRFFSKSLTMVSFIFLCGCQPPLCPSNYMPNVRYSAAFSNPATPQCVPVNGYHPGGGGQVGGSNLPSFMDPMQVYSSTTGQGEELQISMPSAVVAGDVFSINVTALNNGEIDSNYGANSPEDIQFSSGDSFASFTDAYVQNGSGTGSGILMDVSNSGSPYQSVSASAVDGSATGASIGNIVIWFQVEATVDPYEQCLGCSPANAGYWSTPPACTVTITGCSYFVALPFGVNPESLGACGDGVCVLGSADGYSTEYSTGVYDNGTDESHSQYWITGQTPSLGPSLIDLSDIFANQMGFIYSCGQSGPEVSCADPQPQNQGHCPYSNSSDSPTYWTFTDTNINFNSTN